MLDNIISSTEQEREIIDAQIREFNNLYTGFSKDSYKKNISLCIKEDNNQIVAGINGEIYYNNILHIDVLWVKEEYRKYKYGSKLLSDLENKARDLGAKSAYVETFEFQALPFYQKQGYELFGHLDNYTNNGHKLYFLQKKSLI